MLHYWHRNRVTNLHFILFFSMCTAVRSLHFAVGSEKVEHSIFGEEKEYSVNKLDLKAAITFAEHAENEALSLSGLVGTLPVTLPTHASSDKLRK